MSRLYTIPSGVPFLKALARGLLERHPITANPLALCEVSVFLPTRRASRALEEVFLELCAAKPPAALLLPRMRALGDIDEEEILIDPGPALDELANLPAVPALHRRVRLAQLLMRARQIPFSEAIVWSKSLSRFLDEALTEAVDLQRLADVVPAQLSEHFQQSLEFMRILTDAWPRILAEDGFIEAAERRRLLMAAEAEHWGSQPPKALYIAGSTGSIPATTRLMKAALNVPNGTIVLPGLDRTLDEAAWKTTNESHSQYGLRRLLEALGVERKDVDDWPYIDIFEPQSEARARLLTETLRPAPTTDTWARALRDVPLKEALRGLNHVEARDRTEEARVIAIAMRGTLERPGETAALVTPDRNLARRVASELKRWDIEVDDSAGSPLAQAEIVIFLRLILRALREQFAPVSLLSLLKHSHTRLGYDKQHLGALVARLERAALRGPRPLPGLEGVVARLEKLRAAQRQRAKDDDEKDRIDRGIDALRGLLARLDAAAGVFAPLMASDRATASDWANAIARSAENIGGGTEIWRGDAGEAAAVLIEELGELAALPPQTFDEFGDLFDAALEDRVVRPRTARHPRLFIWGPLEARLQSASLIILGGLNEGTWPAHTDDGPWANQVMRRALGLSTAERRIGLSAHDFQELAAAPRVLLTSAQKVDGSPALPSRWLMRFRNFLQGRSAEEYFQAAPYAAWAAALDSPLGGMPVQPPTPKPEDRKSVV